MQFMQLRIQSCGQIFASLGLVLMGIISVTVLKESEMLRLLL